MIIAKVIFFFLILKIDCFEAIETGALIMSNSEEVRVENLLTEFMTDLKKSSFAKLNPKRLAILGKSSNILEATKALLASETPHFISTKPKTTKFPSYFGAESVVLFFIDGFSVSEVNSTFAQLPNDYKCRVLIISTRENTTDQSIASTILSAVERKLRNVMFARFDGQGFKIYGRIPNANCTQEIKLLNKWIPSKGFKKDRNILGHDLVLNERRCPMFVSTFEILPTMMLRKDGKGSSHINGGLEGRLTETIAEYLNMVPVVKEPGVYEKFWMMRNGTIAGIVGDVAREEASLGIGKIRPTPASSKVVDFTEPYNQECMVWVVPLTTKYNHSVVTSEFSTTTWTMVILSVILCCGLVYVTPKLKIGCGSSPNVLDVIAMALNYTIPRPPTSLLCKLFFLLFLNYSRIISTAYTTSLSSILTTTTPDPEISDIEGIFNAGLRIAGLQSNFDLLANQIPPNSKMAELIERYEVITSFKAALERIVDRRDIAYLQSYSAINYIAKRLAMAGKPIEFYALPDCVISYQSVIVTPKGSPLTNKLNHLIPRLREAGLGRHWSGERNGIETPITFWARDSDSIFRLKPVFVLYFLCLIPAFVTFAAELIAFKLKLNWFTRGNKK